MLVARGVDRGRLVIVARASSQPIYAQDSGLRERNRRVTMEPLLESEETP
jgi:flagellar motor protein MotB